MTATEDLEYLVTQLRSFPEGRSAPRIEISATEHVVVAQLMADGLPPFVGSGHDAPTALNELCTVIRVALAATSRRPRRRRRRG